MIKNKRVLISGAGIAGLTLAYWLKQYGFIPTLVERYPRLNTGGYKIDIRGVALEVVKRMGIHSSIFNARTDIQRSIFVDSSGKHIAETSPELCGARVEEDLEITRGELCKILFEQISDVEFLFGDSITDISQNEEGVHVEFEKGKPRLFDLVVGADGLHSRVRKLVFGDESQFLRELGLYIAFYTIPNFLNLDRAEIEYHSPQRFVIAYNTRGDRMARVGFAFPSKPLEFDPRDVSHQQELLNRAFADGGWEVPRLLAAMKDAPDFYFDCMAQIHMPHWTKGRVALAGDAGYAVSPISGQGASMALVGAYVLAGELAEADGDYGKAFSEYEHCLQSFVKKNMKLAWLSATFYGDNKSWLMWLNRFILSLIPASVIVLFKKWGQSRTAKAANALVLKNYPTIRSTKN